MHYQKGLSVGSSVCLTTGMLGKAGAGLFVVEQFDPLVSTSSVCRICSTSPLIKDLGKSLLAGDTPTCSIFHK